MDEITARALHTKCVEAMDKALKELMTVHGFEIVIIGRHSSGAYVGNRIHVASECSALGMVEIYAAQLKDFIMSKDDIGSTVEPLEFMETPERKM
jgi:hypothetical protein